MTIFLDERGYTLTLEQLQKEYTELYATGDTEAETFADYMVNCTDKNGTLTRYERED